MPPPPASPDEGPGLIEPEHPAPTVDLGSLDTGRILRDTGSLQIPDLEEDSHESDSLDVDSAPHESSADAPIESEPVDVPNRAGLNILSVISLILALTLSPFAMVFGYIAVGQTRRSHQRGEALAWASVGLGWLWTIGWVVLGVTLGATWLQL
jgi:hypothetical protein